MSLSVFGQKFLSDRNTDDALFDAYRWRFQVDTSDLAPNIVFRADTFFVWKTIGKDADGGYSDIRMYYTLDFQTFSAIQYTFREDLGDTATIALTCIFLHSNDSLYFVYQSRSPAGLNDANRYIRYRTIHKDDDLTDFNSFVSMDTLIQYNIAGVFSTTKKIDPFVFKANGKYWCFISTTKAPYGGECIHIYYSLTFPNPQGWKFPPGYNSAIVWNSDTDIQYEGSKYLGKYGGKHFMTTNKKDTMGVTGWFTQILTSDDLLNWTETTSDFQNMASGDWSHDMHLTPIIWLDTSPWDASAKYFSFTVTDSSAINKGLENYLVKTYDYTWFYWHKSANDSLRNAWE